MEREKSEMGCLSTPFMITLLRTGAGNLGFSRREWRVGIAYATNGTRARNLEAYRHSYWCTTFLIGKEKIATFLFRASQFPYALVSGLPRGFYENVLSFTHPAACFSLTDTT